MAARIRSSSLPSLQGRGKPSECQTTKDGIRSRPLTASTTASSKTRPSTAASLKSRPSTAASSQSRPSSSTGQNRPTAASDKSRASTPASQSRPSTAAPTRPSTASTCRRRPSSGQVSAELTSQSRPSTAARTRPFTAAASKSRPSSRPSSAASRRSRLPTAEPEIGRSTAARTRPSTASSSRSRSSTSFEPRRSTVARRGPSTASSSRSRSSSASQTRRSTAAGSRRSTASSSRSRSSTRPSVSPSSRALTGARSKAKKSTSTKGTQADIEGELPRLDGPSHPSVPFAIRTSVLQTASRPHPQDLWSDAELLHSVHADVVLGEGNSIEYMYEMIKEGEQVNQMSKHGFTPLALAAAGGSGPLVSLLLHEKADAAVASSHRAELPLHIAASLGHQVVCHFLVPPTKSAGKLDAANVVGWTALHFAAVAGNAGIAHELLKARALPSRSNDSVGGQTALHLAAVHGNAEVLDVLLDFDGDANATDRVRRTPLHFAAMSGSGECVAVLLRHRADVLRQAGHSNAVALDLIPEEQTSKSSERARRLLASYSRPMPLKPRIDARFDLPTYAYSTTQPHVSFSRTPRLHSTGSDPHDRWHSATGIQTLIPAW